MTTDITHEKTPDQHSGIVGGSTANRVLNCPGSVNMLARLQASLDADADKIVEDARAASAAGNEERATDLLAQAEKLRGSLNQSSSYADEGTALHEIMAYIVDNDIQRDDIINDPEIDRLWQQYGLDDKRLWDCVFPAFAAFEKKCDELLDEGGPDDELLIKVENRVVMPGIDGAFGTADIIIRGPKRTVVWDWKFGAGVPVYASYTQAGETIGNDQLMFYARAAQEVAPHYFEPDALWPVDLVICQPRVLEDRGSISEFTTSVADLENFRLDLIDAVEEALGENPEVHRGSWCRFAACKTICPKHVTSTTGMAVLAGKLATLKPAAEAAPADPGAKLAYSEALVAMLDIAEVLEPYLREAQAQAHAYLEAGGRLLRPDGSPAYKLVPKRAGWDKWKEEREKVDGFLARQGLDIDSRRQPWEPISPAQARTKLKAAGKDMKEGSKDRKLLDKYISPGVSSGSTLAPGDDPRPEFKLTTEKVGALAEKIAALGS